MVGEKKRVHLKSFMSMLKRKPGQIEEAIIRWKMQNDPNKLREIVENVVNLDQSLPAEIKNVAVEELVMLLVCYIYQNSPVSEVKDLYSLALMKIRQAGVPVSVAPRYFFDENLSPLIARDWIRLVSLSGHTILQFGHTTRSTAFKEALRKYANVRANVSAIIDGLLEETSPRILIDLQEYFSSLLLMVHIIMPI